MLTRFITTWFVFVINVLASHAFGQDRVELLHGPTLEGEVTRQTAKVVMLRQAEGFFAAVPVTQIHALTMNDLRRVLNAADRKERIEPAKVLSFKTYDKKTIRSNPTTEVAIRVLGWPGNTFLLSLPECVSETALPPKAGERVRDVHPIEGTPFVWRKLWAQWFADVAHQDFMQTNDGGLRWRFDRSEKVHIDGRLIPQSHAVVLEMRVKNVGVEELRDVAVQNCLHLSEAPDFACQDFSRIHIRTDGQWRSLKDLDTADSLPMFYKPGFLESGRIDSWGRMFKEHNQPARADHPMMICVATDGKRSIATASEDYQCVFHNQGSQYLQCIHSQQAPILRLQPGKEAIFRQIICFVDGGVDKAVGDFDKAVKDGILKP